MGFYHIARGRRRARSCGALDYANRRMVIGAPFQPTGDAEAVQAMLAFFRPYPPKAGICVLRRLTGFTLTIA